MAKRLNLRCGTDIRDALVVAKLPGDFVEFGEPICEGPAPAPFGGARYCELRRQFMQRHWHVELAESEQRLAQQREVVASFREYEELLLWFEHDLYDQCILIQILAAIPEEMLERTRLICIDGFPGMERFIGLGQLSPEQLATLPAQAQTVSLDQVELARRALAAWVSPTPDALQDLLEPGACAALPFLAAAIERHLQELPGCVDGVGQTDRLILKAVSEGADRAIAVFSRVHQELERHPYLGDLMFWAHFYELARGEYPGLEIAGEFPTEALRLTEHGRDVVEGRRSHVGVNGIPEGSLYRWRGGIEQCGEKGWVYGWDSKNKWSINSEINGRK